MKEIIPKLQNNNLLCRTINIKKLNIDNPVFLAPMAGVTDKSFRVICKEMGCSLAYSEMISAKGLIRNNWRTLQMIDVNAAEKPVPIQLFGSNADDLVNAAKILEEKSIDIIDFNMGCPMLKIVKNGEGAWLMREPEKVYKILKALVLAVHIPITVKIRSGWDDDEQNALEIAKIAEQAGVSALTIHARTAKQFYSGKANWDIIRQVKENIRIPVIGNGDIFTPQDAIAMFEQTGCDAIMIGRGAQGNPWIFRDVLHYLKTGELLKAPSSEERQVILQKHLDLLIAHKGEKVAMREMRCHAAWYTKGMYQAAHLRQKFNYAMCRQDFMW